LAALLVSVLFKEITLGLFLFLPLIIIFFSKKGAKDVKDLKYWKSYVLLGASYLAFRAIVVLAVASRSVGDGVEAASISLKLFVDTLLLPINIVSQSLVWAELQLGLARFVTSKLPAHRAPLPQTIEYEQFVKNKVFVIVSFSIFFIVFYFSFKIWKSLKAGDRKIFGLSVAWVLINSYVFFGSGIVGSSLVVIDSRNLYFVSIGLVLLVVLFAKRYQKFVYVLVALVVMNIFLLDKKIDELVNVARVRKEIVSFVTNSYVDLPEKVVFYSQSDRSYYGLAESVKILPFQSGFGQMMLIIYQKEEKYPISFFENDFLWNLTDQEYLEVENRGFGYFRDFDKLASLYGDFDGVEKPTLIAFSYDSKSNFLFDITEQVAGMLEGYVAEKDLIAPWSLGISSDLNNEDIGFINDGSLETAWGSGKPYSFEQSIDIDLGRQRRVSELVIDSYTNKDQNNVGYAIEFSINGDDWKEVARYTRTTPNTEGKVNLYTKPEVTRYIRINQIGEHGFATWVIHELDIYETTN